MRERVSLHNHSKLAGAPLVVARLGGIFRGRLDIDPKRLADPVRTGAGRGQIPNLASKLLPKLRSA
jgi:hypothetical protein